MCYIRILFVGVKFIVVCVPGARVQYRVPGQGAGGEGHSAQALHPAPPVYAHHRAVPRQHRPLLRDRPHHSLLPGTYRDTV